MSCAGKTGSWTSGSGRLLYYQCISDLPVFTHVKPINFVTTEILRQPLGRNGSGSSDPDAFADCASGTLHVSCLYGGTKAVP